VPARGQHQGCAVIGNKSTHPCYMTETKGGSHANP
jgi:hypothetical protein